MIRITPDGARYIEMAHGIPQPMPFKLRRGLPQLCRTSEQRWVFANVASMIYAAGGIGILAAQHGAALSQSVFAVALFLLLPWVRFCWKTPVLVDMPALMFAVLAAVALPVSPFAALALAFAGAYVSERVPVWAAIFAWHPILLLALVVPLFNFLFWRTGEVDDDDLLADTLRHPLATGISWHKGMWNAKEMLAPWGLCLFAVFSPSLWLTTAIVVGYAQLLLATDTVRLFQQASPVVCVAAAMVVPASIAWVMPALLLVHWYITAGSDGI